MTTTKRVPKAFRELDTKVLECRAWAHAWTHETTHLLRDAEGRIFEVSLRCLRCGTKRLDVIDAGTGLIDGRSYRHPEGYLIDDVPSWGGRATFNGNVRRELYGRLRTSRNGNR
jgi:hypothetical protein